MGEVLTFLQCYRKTPIEGVASPQYNNVRSFSERYLDRRFDDIRNACIHAFIEAEQQCMELLHTLDLRTPVLVERALDAAGLFGIKMELLLRHLHFGDTRKMIIPEVQKCCSCAREIKYHLERIRQSAKLDHSILVPARELQNKVVFARQTLDSVLHLPQRKPA